MLNIGITRRLPLYSFRHVFATTVLQNSADLKATSEILGHSRPDTTIRVYQHTHPDMHRAVVDLLPDLIQGNNAENAVDNQKNTLGKSDDLPRVTSINKQ
jgi:hypothetical protein